MAGHQISDEVGIGLLVGGIDGRYPVQRLSAPVNQEPTDASPWPQGAQEPASARSGHADLSAAAGPPVERTEAIRDTARIGVSGPGAPLPFLDSIQRSFGQHDVSAVVAHTDSAAAAGAQAMRATAFATGNHVAFAGAPSLHTAAHEAAHVIQQRGGVRLSSGVSRIGDAHERHADAVADMVVAGRSAEALLDAHVDPGQSSPTQVVQREPTTDKQRELEYQNAITDNDWATAVQRLNDFGAKEIKTRLDRLSRDQVAAIFTAAVADKTVGPTSTVAKLAKPAFLDFSYEQAVLHKKWGDAARALDGLGQKEISDRVGKLTSEQRTLLRAAALASLPDAATRITDAVDHAPEIARLKTEKANLEAITRAGSGKSLGEVGGAYSQLKDVSHRLAVLETGTGIYQGSECKSDPEGATISNCTLIVLEVLKDTFVQQGRSADWSKVEKKYQAITKARKGTLSGLDIQTALQTELGWKGIFWAPDPAYEVPKAELSGARSDEADYVAHIAGRKHTYYKNSGEGDPGLTIDQSVINYAPEAPKAGHGAASKTRKDTSGLDKLKKLPFGVLTAHGAHHMALITYGKVVEVHWKEPATSTEVTEQTDLEDWAVGSESGYHFFASGAIVAPANDVAKAFK